MTYPLVFVPAGLSFVNYRIENKDEKSLFIASQNGCAGVNTMNGQSDERYGQRQVYRSIVKGE